MTLRHLCLLLVVVSWLIGCNGVAAPPAAPPTLPPLAKELVLYNWADDLPESVLEAFTAEYGVTVTYETYESMEEAIENMRAGRIYDVVNMDNRFIPQLVEANLLAVLDRAQVPNLKNISASFLDSKYDPGNRYSVPYNWGTVGLIVRTDLAGVTVNRWLDLWNPNLGGKVALYRGQPREVIALTLHALGYSANTENPAQLENALLQLKLLKPRVVFVETRGEISCAPLITSGEVVAAMGYAFDMLDSRDEVQSLQYVLPADGTLLWGENFVIPRNSPNRYTAEVFINYLMRPDINAQIANENLYATPNEAAWPFIKPDVFNDAVIFPPNADLQYAELVLPLNPAVQKLYDDVWARFLAADPQ